MVWHWTAGQNLRNGINWNFTLGFPFAEIVLFWRRRSGRRVRVYLRFDSPRHPRGMGVTTDACSYEVDDLGHGVNIRLFTWWPRWLRQA